MTRLLVATTVIEVGIDVPEAGIIVIEQAERFGLAQLHQLRGRVGRGGQKARCVLLYRPPLGTTARQRLTTLRRTEDGFRIAEADLTLRGPGEVLGTRQSGLPQLRFADLMAHADLLEAARADAEAVLAHDPALRSPRGRCAAAPPAPVRAPGGAAAPSRGLAPGSGPAVPVPGRSTGSRPADGPTIPPEITIFMPSSTDMSRWTSRLSGTKSRNPELGKGDIGTSTFTSASERATCTTGSELPVTKPKAIGTPVRELDQHDLAKGARGLLEEGLEYLLQRAVDRPHDRRAIEQTLAGPHHRAADQARREPAGEHDEAQHHAGSRCRAG